MLIIEILLDKLTGMGYIIYIIRARKGFRLIRSVNRVQDRREPQNLKLNANNNLYFEDALAA